VAAYQLKNIESLQRAESRLALISRRYGILKHFDRGLLRFIIRESLKGREVKMMYFIPSRRKMNNGFRATNGDSSD
jgi:hypothetical protein